MTLKFTKLVNSIYDCCYQDKEASFSGKLGAVSLIILMVALPYTILLF